MFLIRSFKLDDVLAGDRVLFNVNNLWKDNQMPDDYEEVLSKTATHVWIDRFHDNIVKTDIKIEKWMREAYSIGCITKKFPKAYLEDLEKYTENFDTGYFIRVNNVSLKYGCHGTGPYYNMKQIIESMVTCIHGHSCIKENVNDNDICTIYKMPWIPNIKYEFRIFVYNNKITAISEQNIYQVSELTVDIIQDLIPKIMDNYEKNIKKKLMDIGNYVMDLAYLDNNDFYFIEVNSFGAEYSSGSALFHWIHDHDIIYNGFEFRYVSC